MCEKYISERLMNDLTNPLINFLWYLWELYCDPNDGDNIFILSSDGNGQTVKIHSIDKTVNQDFGTNINAEIIIHKDGTKYFMSYKD